MGFEWIIPLILGGLGIGASAAGGANASDAATQAADAQAEAAKYGADLQLQASQEANELQRDIYEQTREDQGPWRDTGVAALTTLADLLGPEGKLSQDFAYTDQDFQTDPGYQFRLDEGAKALERSAAARGGLLSGGTGRALTRYGQDYASNEYDKSYTRAFNEFQTGQANRFNRLSSLAGTGQVATTTIGRAGESYAGNVGANTMYSARAGADAAEAAANARASGYVGSANAWNQAIGQGVNQAQNLYLWSLLK